MIEEFARVLRRFQDVPFRRDLGSFLKGRCIEKTQTRMGVNPVRASTWRRTRQRQSHPAP